MTAPRFADCRCGHAKAEHDRDGFAPQCVASSCTCLAYRPATAPVAPLRPPGLVRSPEPQISVQGERGPSIEQILTAGKRSNFKRTAQLAERIALQIHDLRGRLTDERQAAEQERVAQAARDEAKRKIAALEAQLAEARAALRGTSSTAKSSGASSDVSPGALTAISGEPMPCTEPGCDRTFSNAQGRAMHRRRAHEGFDPHAASAS